MNKTKGVTKMNTQNGWSKIRNDIHDDPILNKDSEYLSVWIYLLTHQAYGEYNAMFSGKVVTLKEGQLLTSLGEISKKTGVTISKINRILKMLKSEKLIETQTDMHKTLITLGFMNNCETESEKQNEKLLKNKWKTEQETENEKEKRSKREKDKEKEINKTIKTDKNIYPPISPQGEKGEGIFLSPENSIFSFDKEVVRFPQTEEELNKWLEEDDGIDDWDKVQLYYKQLHSSQQSAASSQQDSYTGYDKTNSLDNTNPIQQKNNEIYIPQPQTPSPFAAGEITPQACMSSSQRDVCNQPQGCMSSAAGENLMAGNVIRGSDSGTAAPYPLSPDPYTLFEEFWKAYPKKVGKGYAYDCFKKIKVSRKLLDIMLEAIAKQKKSDMWKRDKGQYIPNPSTWLNQKRWEDDLGGETEDEPKFKFKLNGLNGLEF